MLFFSQCPSCTNFFNTAHTAMDKFDNIVILPEGYHKGNDKIRKTFHFLRILKNIIQICSFLPILS